MEDRRFNTVIMPYIHILKEGDSLELDERCMRDTVRVYVFDEEYGICGEFALDDNFKNGDKLFFPKHIKDKICSLEKTFVMKAMVKYNVIVERMV